MAHPPTTPTIESLLVSRADAATAFAISLRPLSYLVAQGLKVRRISERVLIPAPSSSVRRVGRRCAQHARCRSCPTRLQTLVHPQQLVK